MIFLRTDRDAIPDTESYNYALDDKGDWQSAFPTKEEALDCFLGQTYSQGLEMEDEEIENMLVLTDRGWSLPLANGALYGASVPHLLSEARFTEWYFTFYVRPNMYLQVWEGKSIGEAEAKAFCGGDVFIPSKMIACYLIKGDNDIVFKTWLKKGNWDINPWSDNE